VRLRGKFSAGVFARRLRGADSSLREAVTEAAAGALQTELQRDTTATISTAACGARRLVGSTDIEDAEREFGTLEKAPLPWLAPALPLALEPMRVAANKAAARAFSALGKRKK
jgi:hypothetical protein